MELRPAAALGALERWFGELETPGHPLGDRLRGEGGKMIAVLVGRDAQGQLRELRALSGGAPGAPQASGCVPSIIRHERFAALEAHTLRVIEEIRRRLEATDDPALRAACVAERRAASRTLMRAIHETTTLCNRAGRLAALPEVFAGGGIPSGTADCALPKLLHAANLEGLTIESVAEAFFAGDNDRAGAGSARPHGELAPPCARRCVPILGYLVCHVA